MSAFFLMPRFKEEVPISTVTALTISLMGPMQVLVQGQPLPHLHSRKALWLLALLTLRHDRPVEREWLAGTLWPEVDQSKAFANLRPVISALRRALGSEGTRLRSPDRHTLVLDLMGADVDILVFDAAIADGSLARLACAVDLYRGPLLEGVTEDWVSHERQVREQQCLHALLTLAKDSEDSKTRITYGHRAVSLDPLSDTARRSLMESLAHAGDSNAAMEVYRSFRRQLQRDDPKAIPDATTTKLYEHIRKTTTGKIEGTVPSSVRAEENTVVPKVTGSLPHPLAPLVGREEERIEVIDLLKRSRLVTLTGPGGIGKTRLALTVAGQVAPDYPDGVWLIALESVAEGKLVIEQIASVLGLKESANLTQQERVTEYLRTKQLLLVLDNCEHVLDASAQVAGYLLQECPKVQIIATSREALGITGETVWSVPALAVPDPVHLPSGKATLLRVLPGYESVQLFVERAQAIEKSFALTPSNALAAAQVCVCLDGIPLALELAAARTKVMTVEQIAGRLEEHRLNLLTSGSRTAQSRQQTLRATLDWSYNLLTESEQILLQRLSIFSGGWAIEAAEYVCTGSEIEQEQILDLLNSLVDKSLVLFTAMQSGGRYRLLETVRQYASEKREASGESDLIQARHLDCFVHLAEKERPRLIGAEQDAALQHLATEYSNLRLALDWVEKHPSNASVIEAGLRLVAALGTFWQVRSHFTEGRRYMARILDLSQAIVEDDTASKKVIEKRARVFLGAGALAYNQGDYTHAQLMYEESLKYYREIADQSGISAALNGLGNMFYNRGEYASAWDLYQESLKIRREQNDTYGIALVLSNLGNVASYRGDFTASKDFYEESLILRRELGDQRGVAYALKSLGNVALRRSEYALAQTLQEEGLQIRQQQGDKAGVAESLVNLGNIALALKDFASAQSYYEESLCISKEIGSQSGIALSLINIGEVALRQQKYTYAKEVFEETLRLCHELGRKQMAARSLEGLGNVAYREQDFPLSRTLYVKSLHLFLELEDKDGIADSLRNMGGVFCYLGEVETAVHLWGAAHALRKSLGMELLDAERESYELQLEEARSALGEPAFSSAWEEGLLIAWEQAVTLALQEN